MKQKRRLRILIGCESSGAVRREFRALGHDAWSCDLLPADDSSEFHIQGDLLGCLDQGWDLAGFHPPCTFLCSSGLHWNNRGRGWEGTNAALDFVRQLMGCKIPKWYLENPTGCISTKIRKYDQRIQPYQFGEDASKGTCLWLKGLPKLASTLFVPPRMVCGCGGVYPWGQPEKDGCPHCGAEQSKAKPRWANQTDSGQNKLAPSEDRWKERSLTYGGIARAMAEQWGDLE